MQGNVNSRASGEGVAADRHVALRVLRDRQRLRGGGSEDIDRAIPVLKNSGKRRGKVVGLGRLLDLIITIEFSDVIRPAVQTAQVPTVFQRVRQSAAGQVAGVADVDRAREIAQTHAVGGLVDADAEGRRVLAGDRVGHGEVSTGIDSKIFIVRFVKGGVSWQSITGGREACSSASSGPVGRTHRRWTPPYSTAMAIC